MKKNYLLLCILLFCLNAATTTRAQEAPPAIRWQRTLGGSGGDILFAMTATPDKGYILGGYSNSPVSGEKTLAGPGGGDYWIIKLDSAGAISWQKTFGGTEEDVASDIIVCADGGYLVSGTSNSGISGNKTDTSRDDPAFAAFSGGDVWLIRLDTAGNILWQKTYGGLYTEGRGVATMTDDSITAMFHITRVSPTPDGGFIVGTSSSSGISGDKTEINRTENNPSWGMLYFIFADYWIFKIDASGNMQWQKTFGGEDHDRISCIRPTPDGGYLVGGTSEATFLAIAGTNISGGDKTDTVRGWADYWILKLSSTGAIQWQKTIGGAGEDRLVSMDLTTDGGYILGGYSNSGISGEKTDTCRGTFDYWILKLSSTGAIQWQKTIGGNGADLLSGIRQTPDGNYLLSGASASGSSGEKAGNGYGGTTDFWLLKLDPTGQIIWQKTLGGTSSSLELLEMPADLLPTDQGYIVAGISDSRISGTKTDSCRGGNDYWILSLASCSADTSWVNASFCHNNSYTLPGGMVVYTPGTYYSVLAAVTGCDSTVATILSQQAPAITVSRTGNSLQVTPTAGATYQWFDCNAMMAVNGATSAVFQPAVAGYYAVAVSLGDCADTSMCYAVQPTGIAGAATQDLLLYPNPATNQVYLQVPDQYGSVAQVQLFELGSGRSTGQAACTRLSATRYRLSLQGIVAGSYIVVVRTPGAVLRYRLQVLP